MGNDMANPVSDLEQISLEYGRRLWSQFINQAAASPEEWQRLMPIYQTTIESSAAGGYITRLVRDAFSQAEETYCSMRERLF